MLNKDIIKKIKRRSYHERALFCLDCNKSLFIWQSQPVEDLIKMWPLILKSVKEHGSLLFSKDKKQELACPHCNGNNLTVKIKPIGHEIYLTLDEFMTIIKGKNYEKMLK